MAQQEFEQAFESLMKKHHIPHAALFYREGNALRGVGLSRRDPREEVAVKAILDVCHEAIAANQEKIHQAIRNAPEGL